MQRRGDDPALALARRLGLARLLAAQDDVILRAQALALGVPRSRFDQLVRSGRYVRIAPGVFARKRVSSNPRTVIRAMSLWGGAGAVIGGRAALLWHGLLTNEPRTIDLFVPPHQRRQPPTGVNMIRAVVAPQDFSSILGVAVTTIERSCLDLDRWGLRNDYLDLALRARRTTPDAIDACVARSARRRGQVRAREAAASARTNPWSPPERECHRLLRSAGITGWIANARARSVDGEVLPDIAFPAIRLAVEIDGRRYHDEALDPDAFERDHRRGLALSRAGWFVIRITPRQLRDNPHAVLEAIRSAIAMLSAR